MPAHRPASELAALGREWVEAWNSRDLERVLSFYSDEAEMTSVRIPEIHGEPSGTLHGKEALREYWGKGFPLIPNLHFTLIHVLVSPDSLVVFYENERGKRICEYLRVNEAGLIVQGSANHLPH